MVVKDIGVFFLDSGNTRFQSCMLRLGMVERIGIPLSLHLLLSSWIWSLKVCFCGIGNSASEILRQ